MNPYLNKKAIVSKRGQWDYPGQDTIVPTLDGSITMQGVNYPVYGQDETGYGQMMYPNQEYKFPGNMVYEKPMMGKGGEMIKRADGSYSQRGLWDNIRANKGSGNKPTEQMLEQEKKIKKQEMGNGGKTNQYFNKFRPGGKPEGDPEDPDFITPFLTGLASNVQKGLNYGLSQGANALNALGTAGETLKKYQQVPTQQQNTGGYSWGPSTPTEVVNTTGSGHSQTMPSVNTFQGNYDSRMPGEKALQAADKAVGQYLVQPASELVNTPFALYAEGVDALEGQPYDFSRALPNPTRMAFNAEGIDHMIPNQQFLSDHLGVDREKNPYLSMGLDFLTPGPAIFTKPITALTGIGKASTNAIKTLPVKKTPKVLTSSSKENPGFSVTGNVIDDGLGNKINPEEVSKFIEEKGLKIIQEGIETPEGRRRLANQFKQENPNLSASEIDDLVETRIVEAKASVIHNKSKNFAEELKSINTSIVNVEPKFEDAFPLNNAFWEKYNPSYPYSPPTSNSQTNIIKLNKRPNPFIESNFNPGMVSLGRGYLDDIATLDHELGHATAKGGQMPIDRELMELIRPKNIYDKMFYRFSKALNPQVLSNYDYFSTSGGRRWKNEPYPFLRETRRSMIEKGILKDTYDKVTPLKLFKHIFSGEPSRILSFTPPWKFSALSKLFNEAPAVVPGAIGTGAAAATIGGSMLDQEMPQQRFGGDTNPYLKKFRPGGETPTYSWGTSNVNYSNPASIVSTVSSSNTQTKPSITQTTSIPLKNIPSTSTIAKEKKSLPFISELTGLNNSKNDKLYGLDENIYNNNIVFNDVPVDNTYTGINPNMRKVSNAPYVDMSKEGDLNNAARDYLEAIYTSPGYKRKVENELEKSGIVDKTADDIISERLYRVKNTQMKNMSESDRNYETAYGYMQPMTYGPFIASPGITMRTDRVNTQPYNYFSTGIEELEHAAHVKRNRFYNMFNTESSENITPEAKRIFDLHAPASSKESTQYDLDDSYFKKLLRKPYLKLYTENMAKKRASEVYLINKGLLNPGENVNENHYKYLIENYDYLPSNVRSAIDMTNENEKAYQLIYGIDKDFLEMEQDYDNDMKWIKSNKNPNKDDFKLYYNTQIRKENLQNRIKKFKKSQENFLKIMNDIGMNLNNPYTQTARFGTYIIPENKSDSANDTTNTLDKRVNCDCGWSWDISDGGSDPYKCHKCGNDNSYAKGQDGLEANLPKASTNMFSDYNPVSNDYTAAMTGMMKARMATDAEFGNLAAKRMTSLYPKEYTFTGDEMFYDEKVDVPAGATGTHYTTGDGNVMFPIIQEGQDGNLFFNRYANPYNKEAMRFESPQDASYFGENYKNIAPMMYNQQMEKGGESDLVPVEVERSERIYDPKGNLLKEIPEDAPTHEEGGVKLHLRPGTLVFPKKYYKALDAASGLPEFNKIKEKMLHNAEKAYLRGEPYSSGGRRN
jgi:hypothetical protein